MYFMSSSFFLVNSRVSSIYLIQNFSFPDSINSCNIFFCCSVMITFAKIGPKKEEPKETPSLCLYYNDIFQSCLMFRSKLICLVYISFGSKKWDKLAHKSKKVQIFFKKRYIYLLVVSYLISFANKCSSNHQYIIKIKVKEFVFILLLLCIFIYTYLYISLYKPNFNKVEKHFCMGVLL